MTPANTIRPLDDILFVVVTCTMEESRERALRKLIQSLNSEHRDVGFRENLLVFDNASRRTDILESLDPSVILAMSPENLGYWGALYWSMAHARTLFGRHFKHIHPIESDLVIYDLERLAEAAAFLDDQDDIHTVRTQEFSVAQKSRYFKGTRHLLPRRRSQVAAYNGVTEEPVRFEKDDRFANIYRTNWHAKVPALHRFETLQETFGTLARRDCLTELDFMKAAHSRHPEVALLDGGIFYANLNNPIWPWEKKGITGSWQDSETLAEIGYRMTRTDFIPKGTLAKSIPTFKQENGTRYE
jgi:glycosyltransferase involved in cell wall biosynthesis